jgi:hypothetical protein
MRPGERESGAHVLEVVRRAPPGNGSADQDPAEAS